MPVVEGDPWNADDPVWAATGAVPVTAVPPTDAEPAPVVARPMAPPPVPVASPEPDPIPAPARPLLYDFAADEMPREPTIEMAYVAPVAAPRRFRPSVTFVVSVLAAIVLAAGMFATVLEITTDVVVVPGPDVEGGFRTGTWVADDFGDNLSIGGLIAAGVIVAGGVGAAFAQRWAAGLAGGTGLAVAGFTVLILGLAQSPIEAARNFATIPNETEFTLTITRDTGYWLLVAAAALGVVLFFASINDAVGDRRPGLNPWIAALGALAALVSALGPMLPVGAASFSDNWELPEGSITVTALLLVARLVQLVLFTFTGVVGFLTVKRYGLGVAIGGAVPALWLTASTLFELTDHPVGFANLNPGAAPGEVHGVTIIGLASFAAMALLAVIAAYDQSVRERG